MIISIFARCVAVGRTGCVVFLFSKLQARCVKTHVTLMYCISNLCPFSLGGRGKGVFNIYLKLNLQYYNMFRLHAKLMRSYNIHNAHPFGSYILQIAQQREHLSTFDKSRAFVMDLYTTLCTKRRSISIARAIFRWARFILYAAFLLKFVELEREPRTRVMHKLQIDVEISTRVKPTILN